MNQIINMILRRVMGRLINKGVDAGFSHAAKYRKSPKGAVDAQGEPVRVTAEENARRERAGRDQGKQARKMIKNMRRLNKF